MEQYVYSSNCWDTFVYFFFCRYIVSVMVSNKFFTKSKNRKRPTYVIISENNFFSASGTEH